MLSFAPVYYWKVREFLWGKLFEGEILLLLALTKCYYRRDISRALVPDKAPLFWLWRYTWCYEGVRKGYNWKLSAALIDFGQAGLLF